MTMMTIFEYSSLIVGLLTLVVLSLTLVVLRGYARDTKTLAGVAVEQLPRPCIVLQRSADSSAEAVLDGTTVSLADQRRLNFANVGTGPAVNCRYRVKNTADTGETSYQLPEIGPAGNFESDHPLNGLPENAVIIIEYESVAGSSYRTELRVQDRRWVSEISFPASRSLLLGGSQTHWST